MSINSILNIYKKELKAYFFSPMAYIIITIFLGFMGWFFFVFNAFFYANQATLRNFFGFLPLSFSFVIPAITMRLFAEEKSRGSYEMLATLPVSLMEIIVGKFLSSLTFVLLMLLPTIMYAIFISFLGNLDIGPVIGGYLGAILMAAAFCAIGVLTSAFTRNQIISFIIGLAACFTLFLIDKMVFYLPASFFSDLLQFIGADYHFKNIAKGVLDSRDLLYFISIGFLALYGTYLVLEEKK
jgi:ABC-2 type transport system permease protein